MARLILDTTVLVTADRDHSRLDGLLADEDDVAIAAITAAELLAHARRTGRPRGAHDLVIAATASATRRIVLSADAGAFADLPGVTHRE